MQLSSAPTIDVVVSSVDEFVSSIDVACLAGTDAASLNARLQPAVRQLLALCSALTLRAVATKQHRSGDSPTSGPSWAARQNNVFTKEAHAALGLQRRIDAFAPLADAVRFGRVSLEAASIIGGVAVDDEPAAQRLLDLSFSLSVDELRDKARSMTTRQRETDAQKQDRLRRSQYLHLSRDKDNMVLFNGQALPEQAAAWLAKWNAREQDIRRANEHVDSPLPVSAALAEGFCQMLSESGSSSSSEGRSSTIAFHVDFAAWQRGWTEDGERCEIAGIGPVPLSELLKAYEHSALRLLMTSKNKLLWYSEESWRDRTKPLPEPVKRAAKAAGYDTCRTSGCDNIAREVDHDLARSLGGTHAFENLNGLCSRCHAEKTAEEVPWTVAQFYARHREPPSGGSTGTKTRTQAFVPLVIDESDQMFPDTS